VLLAKAFGKPGDVFRIPVKQDKMP